jgi:hypothetical protein
MSAALSANPTTSIFTLLNHAKAASAQAGPNMTPMQQHAMIENVSAGMFSCLSEVLTNLAAALDGRVFVATGRGLWDFIGRDLLEFVENLQVIVVAACAGITLKMLVGLCFLVPLQPGSRLLRVRAVLAAYNIDTAAVRPPACIQRP